MSHTKEPWIHDKDENLILDPDGKMLVEWQCRSINVAPEIRDANARRIVACVNSCSGLSTSFLELIPVGGVKAMIRTAALEQEQRDTYRDLCADLLEAINKKYIAENLNQHIEAMAALECVIAKAQSILGDSNAT